MKLNRLIAFLVALVITLLLAWQANHPAAAAEAVPAAAPTCGGRDLLEELQRSDPAAHAALLEEERRTLNGGALLWQVEKSGVPASYLFGTMHMSDERLTVLPAPAAKALAASGTVALELTEIIDEEKLGAETIKNIGHVAFLDGRSLETILSPQQMDNLKAALQAYQMDFASIRLLKPWFLAVALALPVCEIERKKAGIDALDVSLGRNTLERGARLVGLESVADQFAAFDALTIEEQKSLLLSSLQMMPLLNDQIETMTRLYVARRIGAIWGFNRYMMQKHAVEGEGADKLALLERFNAELVLKRNLTMQQRAVPLIDQGSAFIAVGALHLPGEGGLVALLQKAGYAVTPIY